MEHTPGPWRVYKEKFRPQISDMVIVEIQDSNGKAVVPWTGFDSANQCKKEKEANAEFIVRACNSHDELLEACKVGLQWVPKTKEDAIKIRAAIKKAERG